MGLRDIEYIIHMQCLRNLIKWLPLRWEKRKLSAFWDSLVCVCLMYALYIVQHTLLWRVWVFDEMIFDDISSIMGKEQRSNL